jgi:microcystin-dependent protein
MTTRFTWRGFCIAAAASAAMGAISVPAFGAEPYVGEIRWVGSNFCPLGWAPADGQVLPISEYEALFSLIGTTFGGDGQTTFALPDLRARVSVHTGNANVQGIMQGDVGGSEQQALASSQLPSHSHTAKTEVAGATVTSVLYGSAAAGLATSPAGAALAVTKRQGPIYAAGTPDQAMANGSVVSTAVGGTATTTLEATNSGAAAVPVRDPYLGMKSCISLFGVFPSQS